MSLSKVYVLLDRMCNLIVIVALKTLIKREPCFFRQLAIQILARQHTEGERRVGKQTNFFAYRHFRETNIEGSVYQTIRILNRDNTRQIQLFR